MTWVMTWVMTWQMSIQEGDRLFSVEIFVRVADAIMKLMVQVPETCTSVGAIALALRVYEKRRLPSGLCEAPGAPRGLQCIPRERQRGLGRSQEACARR